MLPEKPSALTASIETWLMRPRSAVIVCAIAVAIGLALSLGAWINVSPFTPDSRDYTQGARSLAHTGTYAEPNGEPLLVFPPGYSALIAATVPLGFSEETGGRVVSLALSTLSIVLVFVLLRGCFGSSLLGAGGAVLFSLLPERVFQSTMIWSDPAFLFFVLLSLVLAARWLREEALPWAGALGIAAGIGYLVRPEGALIFAVVLAIALIGTRLRRRIAAGALVAIIGFGLCASPYVLFLQRHTGQWQLTGKSDINFSIAHAKTFGTPWHQLRMVDAEGNLVIPEPRVAPADIARRSAHNTALMVTELASRATPLPYALSILGLASLLFYREYRPMRIEAVTTLIVLAMPLAYLAIFFFENRMLIQPALLVLVLGAAGGRHLVDLFSGARARQVAIALAALLVISMLAYNGNTLTLGAGMEVYDTEREKAEWIRLHYPEERAIVGRAWYVAYRAELAHIEIPYGEVEDVAKFARNQGVRLLLLPKRGHHRSINELASDPQHGHGLIPLREWEESALFLVNDPAVP